MKKVVKRRAFDRDCNSEFAELFLRVRDFIRLCIGEDVKERYNENTSSFYNKEGGFCSIRVKDDYIYLSWFKGAYIEDKFSFLEGESKVSRFQKIRVLDRAARESIDYYIRGTLIYLIEYNELKKIHTSNKKS